MTVEGLRAARPGCRVVVPSGRLDLGPMTLGGRVVEGEGEPLGDRNLLNGQVENGQSEILDLEPEGGEEVIIGTIAPGDSRGAEPTGDGPPPLGEDDTDDQPLEPPGVSAMKMSGESPDPAGKLSEENDASHPSSSWGIVS